MNTKVSVRKLPVFTPPLNKPLTAGGRIMTPSGELTQISNGVPFQFLVYIEFDVNSVVPRGNHYHEAHEEFLYIIRGKLRAIYKDIDTGHIEDILIEEGDLVNVKQRCAHVYFPLEYAQAVEFSALAFDPTDTLRHIVASEIPP